jgi:hypothetical protein
MMADDLLRQMVQRAAHDPAGALQYKLWLSNEVRQRLADGDMFQRLADLARIPQGTRREFSGDVVVLVIDVWEAKAAPLSSAIAAARLRKLALGQEDPLEPRPRSTGGRPVKDLTFRVFVQELLCAAELNGGRFTLSKSYGSGTLIEAIEMLRPHLPDGFVKRLVPSTLQYIRRDLRRLGQ